MPRRSPCCRGGCRCRTAPAPCARRAAAAACARRRRCAARRACATPPSRRRRRAPRERRLHLAFTAAAATPRSCGLPPASPPPARRASPPAARVATREVRGRWLAACLSAQEEPQLLGPCRARRQLPRTFSASGAALLPRPRGGRSGGGCVGSPVSDDVAARLAAACERAASASVGRPPAQTSAA